MSDKLNIMLESKKFITEFYKIFDLYFKFGAKSSQKTDYFHNLIKIYIEKYIKNKKLNNYEVKLEQLVVSINSSGTKRCDIVVYKNDKPYIILPVKLAMSSYKKNKNNYWEHISGDCSHLKWATPDIKIIPINILINVMPNLNNNKKILNFENINHDDIKIYKTLEEKGIVEKFITYILEVEHSNKIGDIYNKCPSILGFDKNTPYIPIFNVLENLIN